MNIYWHLPVFLQEIALSLYAGRLDRIYYGKGYKEWREYFKSWEKFSQADGVEWQSQRLQFLLQLVATKVPFYQESFRDIELKGICYPKDLIELPLLNKQEIRQNEHRFLVEGVNPKSLWVEKTSGTTGTSLKIFWPMAMVPQWYALFETTVRNVAGVGRDIPRAMMGGRSIIQGNTNTPPYWRFNKRWGQLYLSSYHVSRSTAPHYVNAIKKYGSQWITGYGSSIAALAESAMEADLPPVPLKVVIVSGDTLLPKMRSSIEQFFQCKCFDSYGQCEGVCMAMECPLGKMHVIPAAGILEILREDGSPCRAGEVGEMVGTGLLNDAMPLIRYRLGDYAAWAEDQECPCGNPHSIIQSLEGRIDDYLITSDGRKIGRLSTAVKRSPSIHSAQIVQDRPGHAYLLVRPTAGYLDVDGESVREDILGRIGSFDLELVKVSEIPKTMQGKTSLVVRLNDRPEQKQIYQALLNNYCV